MQKRWRFKKWQYFASIHLLHYHGTGLSHVNQQKKHSSVNKQSKFQQVFLSLYKHKQKSVTSGNSFISSNLRQNESNKFLTVPQSFCCFYQQFCGVDICQIAIRYYTTFTRCGEERTCINMEIISGLILHPCRLVRNFC